MLAQRRFGDQAVVAECARPRDVVEDSRPASRRPAANARLQGAPLQPVGVEQVARLAVRDVHVAIVIGVLQTRLDRA